MTHVSVPLRHGIGEAGAARPQAVLRALTGAEEIALASAHATLTAASVASRILGMATIRIGSVSPVREAEVRDLTVGDRERLLLALYGLTFGQRLDLIARCPSEACGEKMDIALTVDDLLSYLEVDGGSRELLASAEGIHLRLRLPTGADHEAAAALAAAGDIDRAVELMIRRCLAGAWASDGSAVDADVVATRLSEPVSRALKEGDPEAELAISFACTACGAEALALVDGLSLIGSRLSSIGEILGQVHRIARTYHWSEAEILALSVERRRRYLDLIAHEGAGA